MDGLATQAGMAAGGIDPLKNGYYFFDPEDLVAGNVTAWDGNIPESDQSLYLTATQSTGPDQPVADGLARVIFADNSDHLDITSTSQAGWQIVGTSLGTFAYKVDSDAITELNLLGNLGGTAYRQTGDLYGIILLPDTATAAQVEAARQLLISRGAADGVTATNLTNTWRERRDIVKFKSVDTSNATEFLSTWRECTSLASFDLIDSSNVIRFSIAWLNCTSLESFPLIDTSNGTNFTWSWLNCSSLSSFPAGMFDSWNPASISNNVFDGTWDGCSSLTPQSVENILVSIATSGKYATINGASGGTALTDPEIDIDYDGTGLTTATNTAITTLKSRGWGIRINGVLQ